MDYVTLAVSPQLRAESFSISRWIVGSGSHAGIYPSDHKFRAEIVKALSGVEGVRVFTRSNIPHDLHYSDSRNSPPILVLAEPQTIILSNPTYLQPVLGHHRVHQARRRFPPDMNSNRLMDQTRMGLAGYSIYTDMEHSLLLYVWVSLDVLSSVRFWCWSHPRLTQSHCRLR